MMRAVLGSPARRWAALALAVVIVAAAVLGGVGDAYGAMLGAVVIGLASEIEAAYFNPEYKQVVAFVVLVVVLLLRPQGILAEIAVQREISR